MRVTTIFLSMTVMGICLASEPQQHSGAPELIAAEVAWYDALATAIRDGAPVVAIEATQRITSLRLRALQIPRRGLAPAPPMEDRDLTPVLLERLLAPGPPEPPPVRRMLVEPPRPASEANVRWACYTALLRLGHTPDFETLMRIEQRMGRSAALVLAANAPDIEFLRRSLEPGEQVDLAYILAWNTLRRNDRTQALLRSCWSAIRVVIIVDIFNAEFRIAVPRVEPSMSMTQQIGGLILTSDPWDGDAIVSEAGTFPLWLAWYDRRRMASMWPEAGPDPGTGIPAMEARALYLRGEAILEQASHGEMLGRLKLRRRELARNVSLDQAKQRADALVAETIDAWSTVRQRIGSSTMVWMPTLHPPIAVSIMGDSGDCLAEWSVDPAPAQVPAENAP